MYLSTYYEAERQRQSVKGSTENPEKETLPGDSNRVVDDNVDHTMAAENSEGLSLSAPKSY